MSSPNYDYLKDILQSIKVVEEEPQELQLIAGLSKPKQTKVISFVNAHAFNLAFTNDSFAKSIALSDLILIDGIGVKMLFKTLGRPAGLNMCGTDFIPKVLKHFSKESIALLGTENPYLQSAADKLISQGHNIVLINDGFQDMAYYLKCLEQEKPMLVVLGMGMPKQELLSLYLKEHLSFNCVIINGGAIIDFIGGKVSRAPLWIRKMGLEWFYRLLKEPRRLFKRYVIGNLLFIYRISTLKKLNKESPNK